MRFGFLMAYNEASWIGFTIDQAMLLCDKLLIIEGSQFANFLDIPERSDDGTLDVICDKEKQYPRRIKIIKTIRENGNYRINQCANFNLALSYCDIGGYFISLPADEFYPNSTIDEMNQLMDEGRMDYFVSKMRAFAFSFKWTFAVQNAKPIYKKTSALRHYPTCKASGFGPIAVKSEGISGHHYTFVKPRERMRLRMKTSGMYQGMLEWFDANWDKVELSNGGAFKYIQKSFVLRRYDGPHPIILDDHPWRHVEDVRKTRE